MVIFQTLKYKNFLSTGNQFIEIKLNKSSTTLIAGTNGAGKSTILDAIFFALFNKPFRNIKKPQLVNSINERDLEVVLDFSIGKKEYKIIRGMRPKKFEIYENGTLVNQDADARDYQKFLEENILGGLNEKVFKQVVVIGSADYSPFMQLRAADRREVIEELLDITIFSEMLIIAKERLGVLKQQLMEMDYSIDLSNEKIKLREEVSAKHKEESKAKIKELQDKIDSEKEKIEKIKSVITDLEDKKSQLSEKYKGNDILRKSISDLQKLLSDLQSTKKSHSNKIAFFDGNDECPTCQQDIEKEHKEKLVSFSQSKLDDVDGAIERLKTELTKKEAFLDKFEKIQKTIQKYENKIYENNTDIKSSERYINRMQSEISSLEAPKEDHKETISTLRKEHKTLTDKRKSKLDEQAYYNVASGMLKDGGIKTKIIRQYVPLMNKIINDYLVRFGLPIEFTLDENFNEVIKSRYRDGFQYNNFSEGEKQRIDTALLLAWRQIAKAKNTTNTNLLIMDETFDSSLDGTATEELLNILLEMDKHTNIFIISHKQDLSDKLRSHIEFEKHGNFTRIKSQPD